MAQFVRTTLLSAVVACLGCGPRGPDAKSGPDAHRHKAQKVALGQEIGDSISYKEKDRTDWKVLELLDAGVLLVEVVLDNPKADVELTVYDRYGKRITGGRAVHHKGDPPLLRLMLEVDAGKYFFRIRAVGEDDHTGYLFKTTLR